MKNVLIVDDEETFVDEVEIVKLKSKLPNVEIQIIPADEFEPDLSEKFLRHRDAIREKLGDHLDETIVKP